MAEPQLLKEPELKKCIQCEFFLSLADFPMAGGKLRSRCRSCYREFRRTEYRRNPQKHIEKTRQYKEKNKEKVAGWQRNWLDRTREVRKGKAHVRYLVAREWIWSLKSVPCADCGREFPPECMDFDHVTGEKIANVGEICTRSREFVESEIAKTQVVCACCHRIRTRKRREEMAGAGHG